MTVKLSVVIKLCICAVSLFCSFLFALVAVLSPAWSNKHEMSLFAYPNNASLVTIIVMILLGIFLQVASSFIMVIKRLGRGKRVIILAAVLMIIAGVLYLIGGAIYISQVIGMVNVYYRTSFILIWFAVPLSWVPGVILLTLRDGNFLNEAPIFVVRGQT